MLYCDWQKSEIYPPETGYVCSKTSERCAAALDDRDFHDLIEAVTSVVRSSCDHYEWDGEKIERGEPGYDPDGSEIPMNVIGEVFHRDFVRRGLLWGKAMTLLAVSGKDGEDKERVLYLAEPGPHISEPVAGDVIHVNLTGGNSMRFIYRNKEEIVRSRSDGAIITIPKHTDWLDSGRFKWRNLSEQ